MAVSLKNAVRGAAVHAILSWERLESGIAYNPASGKMAQDPYPGYAPLRNNGRVHRSRLCNAWILSHYRDVDTDYRDWQCFSGDPTKAAIPGKRSVIPDPGTPSMLSLDPPAHRRLRSLVNKAFTLRAISALEPRIRSLMHGFLDRVEDLSGFDLMTAVARPLPVTVIAEMLGVPAEDGARFRVWTELRARIVEPAISAAERAEAIRVADELDAYFAPIVEERRHNPRGDILSALARAEEEGDRLDARETLNMLRPLLVGGNETTVNLIGNGMLALLRCPDQLQRLRDNPSLVPAAVEELLRYDAPVQINLRRVVEDCEIDGFPVRRGDDPILLLGSANRDPEQFRDPDRLDVARNEGSHLSFGRGIHHCVGASLARLEGRIAIEVLLERFSSIGLAGPLPRFRVGIVLRGLQSLPLAAVPARSDCIGL